MALAKGTLVMTKNGWKSVGQIILNDYLYTHNSRFQRTTIKKPVVNQNTVTLYIKTLPGIRLTTDSRVLVCRNNNYDFVPVDELHEGDLIAILKNKEELRSDLTEEQAYLLGLYCAYGKIIKKKNERELYLVLPKKTNIDLPWEIEDMSAPDDRLTMIKIPDHIRKLCITYATTGMTRFIPNIIFCSDKICNSFINAYSLTNKKKIYSFKNKEDAFVFASILEKAMGVKSSIRYSENKFFINSAPSVTTMGQYYLCPLENKVYSETVENVYKVSSDADFSVTAGGIFVKG